MSKIGAAKGKRDLENEIPQMTELLHVYNDLNSSGGKGVVHESKDDEQPKNNSKRKWTGKPGEEDDKAGKGKQEDAQTKKKRFTWSDDLHRIFMASIFDVGLKHAKPKSIMELMGREAGVPSTLTSEHIKSHLQKYRANSKKTRTLFYSQFSVAKAQVEHSADGKALNPGFHAYPMPLGNPPITTDQDVIANAVSMVGSSDGNGTEFHQGKSDYDSYDNMHKYHNPPPQQQHHHHHSQGGAGARHARQHQHGHHQMNGFGCSSHGACASCFYQCGCGHPPVAPCCANHSNHHHQTSFQFSATSPAAGTLARSNSSSGETSGGVHFNVSQNPQVFEQMEVQMRIHEQIQNQHNIQRVKQSHVTSSNDPKTMSETTPGPVDFTLEDPPTPLSLEDSDKIIGEMNNLEDDLFDFLH